MSVNEPAPDTGGTGELLPRGVRRAVNHQAGLEATGSEGSFGIVPNALSRFSLIPTKGIGDTTFWTRRNDYANIAITAGVSTDRATGNLVQTRVPRGGLANLALLWLVNQTRQNFVDEVDNPERIDLGHTHATFLTSLGVEKGGRQYKLSRQALRDVLSARITFVDLRVADRGGQSHEVERFRNADLSEEYELWEPNGHELDGFSPYAIVSPFLRRLATDARAIPIRLDVAAQLADSVIAQQALTWLTLETFVLDVQQAEYREYTWDALFRNITHNYASVEKFRAEFKRQVERVLVYFPQLREYIDLAAIPHERQPGSGQHRVIRIRRGARPIVPPKTRGGLTA